MSDAAGADDGGRTAGDGRSAGAGRGGASAYRLADRSVRPFDRTAPGHVLAVGAVTAALLSIHGIGGAVAAVLVVLAWARAGPIYAVAVGGVGVFAAGAVVAAFGDQVALLDAPVSLTAGSRTALLVHGAVGLALLTVPFVAYLGPDSRRTLAAGAVAAVPVGGIAAGALASTGAVWIAAAAGLTTALVCAAGVYRYQVVGLRRTLDRSVRNG